MSACPFPHFHPLHLADISLSLALLCPHPYLAEDLPLPQEAVTLQEELSPPQVPIEQKEGK